MDEAPAECGRVLDYAAVRRGAVRRGMGAAMVAVVGGVAGVAVVSSVMGAWCVAHAVTFSREASGMVCGTCLDELRQRMGISVEQAIPLAFLMLGVAAVSWVGVVRGVIGLRRVWRETRM